MQGKAVRLRPPPTRLDTEGHTLMRFIQRRGDMLGDIRGVVHLEQMLRNALVTAEYVADEDAKLTTWRILGDVIVSVDARGYVRTVHKRV